MPRGILAQALQNRNGFHLAAGSDIGRPDVSISLCRQTPKFAFAARLAGFCAAPGARFS